ncbi:MAG: TolC family outer membrane protein [Methylotenera sp.]|uniref:TolC family outer membrane protein n=1 Tax=Methylotenera sp. TaxID=2051956 RepID=UPI002488D82A|nr:TolC family outer membrane protein [Methylotenera sp.]MDI1309639.1 TolC family outer membrane protein [Methylotenera sp.]
MMYFRLLALGMAIYANQAQAYDLFDAWQGALTHDPQFAASKAGAEAGKTKIQQAQALKSPQVTLNAGVAGVSNDNKITDAQFSNAQFAGASSGSNGTTNFRTKTNGGLDLNMNLRAEYPLYDATRNSSATQLNKQAELAEVQLSGDEQQLMLRVAQAYFDALLAQDSLATLNSQQVAITEALASAKERFKEGDVAIIDTHETQARYDMLASQVLEAAGNLQLVLAALGDMTGEDIAANNKVILALLPPKVDLQHFSGGDLQSWINRAQMNHPQVHIQQLQQDIAQAEIGKHQGSLSPIVNLVALAGGERLQGLDSHDASLTNRQVSLGLQLTIPLYSGGMRDARYQEAVALQDKARNQTEVAKQQVAHQARSAWMALNVGQGQVKALEQAEHSAEVKLDSTRLGRDVGDRTMLDVLNSEQELNNTRLALSRSRYQVLLALLNLSASAGELNEARLKEINQQLNSKAVQK